MHMYLLLQSINWGSTLNCWFDSGACYVNYFWVEGIHYNIVLWQVHFKLNFLYTQDYITHKCTWQDQIYIQYELAFPCTVLWKVHVSFKKLQLFGKGSKADGQYSNCTLHLARKTLHVRVMEPVNKSGDKCHNQILHLETYYWLQLGQKHGDNLSS